MSTAPAIGDLSATCDECGAVEAYEFPLSGYYWRLVLAVEFRWLCYRCWHDARSRQQPWHWRRHNSPEFRSRFEKDFGYDPGEFYVGMNASAYLWHEALDLNERYHYYDAQDWELAPAKSWFGDRITHPGYRAMRKGAVLSHLSPEQQRAYK